MAPTQRIAGQRLDTLQITSSTEGAVIPRVYGRMRIGGNIIWATDFREETETTRQGGGGKGGGGGGGTEVTEYFYFASFAVALCEGPITGIGRIWADGKPMDLDGVTCALHLGRRGPGARSVHRREDGRGEHAGLSRHGLCRLRGAAARALRQPAAAALLRGVPPDRSTATTAEGLVRAVTLIPASGEFAYATEAIRTRRSARRRRPRTSTPRPHAADIVVALDRLQACAPKVESGRARRRLVRRRPARRALPVRPGVEVSAKATTPANWSVNGVEPRRARISSAATTEDRPAYGGTPADFAVVQAIQELKARGLPGHLLSVHPDGRAGRQRRCRTRTRTTPPTTGQPAYPWRGRITCSPAAGYAGSVDKTAAAGTQVAALLRRRPQPSDFDVDDEQRRAGPAIRTTGACGG